MADSPISDDGIPDWDPSDALSERAPVDASTWRPADPKESDGELDGADWPLEYAPASSAAAATPAHCGSPRVHGACDARSASQASEQSQTASAAPAPTLQRPFPDAKNLTRFPAVAARSALFRVGRGKKPGLDGPVKCPGQYELHYKGPRLSMRDKRIWEIAVVAAKKHGLLDSEFQVSLSSFVKGREKTDTSKAALDSVHGSLKRLAAGHIDIVLRDGAKGAGALLTSVRLDDSKCYLSIGAGLAQAMFELDAQFVMKPERSGRLKSDLAQWLHDYLGTHEKPADDKPMDDLTVGYLRALCGSEADDAGFLKALRTALAQIHKAAPQLVAGHEIIRVGRHAANWLLRIRRGDEKPSFEMSAFDRAKRAGSKGQEKQSKGPAKQSKTPRRRGGVAL